MAILFIFYDFFVGDFIHLYTLILFLCFFIRVFFFCISFYFAYVISFICSYSYMVLYFFCEFAIDEGFYKNHNIYTTHLQSNYAKVSYRYFKYILFLAKAILKSYVFFANYLDLESEEYMFK
jgi:hypothetical protein